MNDLVKNYKRSKNEIDRIKTKNGAERTKIDNEIEGINEYYAASVNVLNEDRMKKVNDLERQKNFINRKAMEEIEELKYVSDEVNEIIRILTGEYSSDVHRFTEDEMEKACWRNKKVYFYDEMYDSDSMCLRAVIVGKKGRVAALRKKINYSLVIVGHGESVKKYDRLIHDWYGGEYFYTNFSRDYDSIYPHNILFTVKTGFDLNELIEYYQEHVKEREENDLRMEFLNDAILLTEKQHEKKLEVQEKYSMDDFKDILKYVCPDCGKDGSLNEIEKLLPYRRCKFCNAVLIRNVEVE